MRIRELVRKPGDSVTIQIRGVGTGAMLWTHVRRRLSGALGRVGVTPVRAVAAFVDDNGPKGGPALRCALTVHLPYQPPVRVEASASDRRTAFDDAFAALERRLGRYRERQREGRRHPRKYYLAKRLLA